MNMYKLNFEKEKANSAAHDSERNMRVSAKQRIKKREKCIYKNKTNKRESSVNNKYKCMKQ